MSQRNLPYQLKMYICGWCNLLDGILIILTFGFIKFSFTGSMVIRMARYECGRPFFGKQMTEI